MKGFLKRKKDKKHPLENGVKGDSADEEDEFHDTAETLLHQDAHEEGGFGFTNKELLARQRSVISEIIREMGKKLLSGHLNLVNVSLPVRIFEPRSYLEKLTDVWVHPQFLTLAAESTDPLVRMQHTITWFVAGLQHVYQSWRKPFNPILGETFESVLSDGSRVYVEQISHHPPISAFQLDGPGGLYEFSGVSQPEVSFELKANSVKTVARGERRARFHDGGEIQIDYPIYYMRGLLYTSMPRGDMHGLATFLDRKNRLMGEVIFGKVQGKEEEPLLQRADSIRTGVYEATYPETPRAASPPALKRRSFSGLTSMLSRHESSGYCTAPQPVKGRLLVQGLGNWLSHLDWAGERSWTLMHDTPAIWTRVEHPLPSDSRFRPDLQALKEGDLFKAQAAKEKLEQRQREDAKMRKPALDALTLQFGRSVSLGQ